MPSLTLAQHKTEVKALAGDPSGDYFDDDTRLNRVLNQAKDRVVGLIDRADEAYFDTTGTIAVVADTREYALPTDFKYARKVTRPNGTSTYALRAIKVQEIEMIEGPIPTAAEGVQFYYLSGVKIGFVPLPKGAVTVTLRYAKRVADNATDGNPFADFPPEWEHLVDLFAALQLKAEANEDPGLLMALARDEEARLMHEVRRRARSEPRHVNVAESLDVL